MKAQRAHGSACSTGSWVFLACVVAGFASFKSAQSVAYATAMSPGGTPFIMLSNLSFAVVTSFPIVVAYCVAVVLAYKGWMPSFKLPVVVPALLLASGGVLSLLGVFDALEPFVHLVVVCVMYGMGTALLTLAWVEVFASVDVVRSMQMLASAALLSALLSNAVMRLPPSAVMVCVAALSLAGVALYLKAKRIVLASEGRPSFSPVAAGRYAKGLASISNGLAVLLALGCVVGILNSFMLIDGYAFEGSDRAGGLGVVLGYCAFFVVAYAMPRRLGMERAYRILFPVLATLLLAWPFLGFRFGYLFSVLFIMGYQFASVGVMYLIVRESHDRSLNPYVFMGASAVMIRLSVLAGVLIGGDVASRSYDWISKAMLIVAIAMYALAFVLLYLSRGRKAERDGRKGRRSRPEPTDDEAFRRKAAELGKRYGLTEREQGILSHLARGRTSTYIGEQLWLSPNTVRGHIKKIYVKLDIHSKQELIDLFLD